MHSIRASTFQHLSRLISNETKQQFDELIVFKAEELSALDI